MNRSRKQPTPTGRGTGLNRTGRFEPVEIHIDHSQREHDPDLRRVLERPPVRYFEDTSRSIVSENHSPDIPFQYSINPYRGCLHGCSYCYARPTHEYLGFSAGLDFETRIFVKTNAAELFRRWLSRPEYHPEPVMMSGVTDCYQPVERMLQITRSCLTVAAAAAQPVVLVTKNRLISRDLDLLAPMASRQTVRIALSITSLDQQLTKVLEPAASAPAARLQAVRELSEQGIPVHILLAPVIPGLNDSEIPAILEAAAAAGATSASHILLRLPHSVKHIFSDWLRQHRPAEKQKVLTRLKRMRSGKLHDHRFGHRMTGQGPLADQISALFRITARKLNLDRLPPALSAEHFRPPDGQGRLF